VGLPQKTRRAIRDALAEVDVAKVMLKVAVDRLGKHPDGPDRDDLVEGHVAAQTNLKGARANLGQVIASETNHLSTHRSSLVAIKDRKDKSKNQPPSVSEVRAWEAKITNDTPLADRDEVAGAILKSKELRIVGELALASAAMKTVAKNTKNPQFNPSQTEERKNIVADVSDYVTQTRPEEVGLARKDLAQRHSSRGSSL